MGIKKYTPFKKLFSQASQKKREKILNSPEKYLLKKPREYSPGYLTQLKYKIKKRYGG